MTQKRESTREPDKYEVKITLHKIENDHAIYNFYIKTKEAYFFTKSRYRELYKFH